MKEGDIKNFFERQLENWELARKNVESLKNTLKKSIRIKNVELFVQYNPSRSKSTLAKVDEDSIKKRKCFLCRENRPEEQLGIEIIKDWELLVNPFPILPYHFTIAHIHHTPQELNIETGVKLAKQLPGFVVFYNDSGAGASAPDHLHFQAVPLKELPFINLLDQGKEELIPNFKFITEEEKIQIQTVPMNVFFWHKEDENITNFFAIPRKSHRPKEYFLEIPERRAVSPGAIDMAGVIVTPFEEDYIKIDSSDIENIYHQVAFFDD